MSEPSSNRKLAAVLAADIVGYSRLMQADDEATVATLKEYRAAVGRIIARHAGRVVNTPGDSVLAEFRSAQDAVRAAVDVQHDIEGRNRELADDRQMHFRIGVNLGDVIEEDDGTLYGDGVNIAARMEALAEGGGICISSTVYDAITGKLGLGFDFLGEQQVKNIAQPIRVYRVRAEPRAAEVKAGPAKRRWPLYAGAGAAVVVFVALGAWSYLDRVAIISERSPADSLATPLDQPSIAVLPFTNMSDDPKQEYFVDGITEDLITELSRFDGLLVIARNSTFRFKGQAVDVAEVSRALGVRYVLEGGVRRAGEQVRVTAQLIDASTSTHLWAERYDRDLTDIFAVQDEITREIITALRSELGEATATRKGGPLTASTEAYDLYLQGRVLADRRTADANARAQDLFLQAIARDPTFAAAYAELALARFLGWYYAWPGPMNDLNDALSAAEKAVALDQFLPLAHARLAIVQGFSGRLDEALGAARRAVELDANYAEGHAAISTLSAWAGDAEQALMAADRALRLDPYSFLAEFMRGQAYFVISDYDKAIAAFRAALALNPDFGVAHQFLTATYGLIGRDDEAKAQAAEVVRVSPDFLRGGILKQHFRDEQVLVRIVDGLRKAGLEVSVETH